MNGLIILALVLLALGAFLVYVGLAILQTFANPTSPPMLPPRVIDWLLSHA